MLAWALLGTWAAGRPGPADAGPPPVDAGTPPLMLARDWAAHHSPAGWWVSEKYDGLRGYWDGRRLLTRGGTPVAAPPWFTAGWPDVPLDGELWAGRGRFEQAVGTVRDRHPDETAWRQIRYQVFDLPGHDGPFRERLAALQARVAALGQAWVQAVPQVQLPDAAALRRRLDDVLRAGGEGLVLHHGDAFYQPGRSDQLRKYKPWDDAEAEVVAHLPGRGRHAGRLGALRVRTPDGRQFDLGSGLSDVQRLSPPPVGSWITYRYRGTTARGLPRFASFLRLHADA